MLRQLALQQAKAISSGYSAHAGKLAGNVGNYQLQQLA
jgi:hypothetical protein